MSVWENNDYTESQIDALSKANRQFRQQGEPQKAQILVMQMEEGLDFDEIELPGDVNESRARRLALRPETDLDAGLVDIPPRTGPGSGADVWHEFAELVSTIDEEVIDQFSRDEVIRILIDRDIIDGDASGVVSKEYAEDVEAEVEDTAIVGQIPRDPVAPGELTEASE